VAAGLFAETRSKIKGKIPPFFFKFYLISLANITRKLEEQLLLIVTSITA
jgi:hypothetical protein